MLQPLQRLTVELYLPCETNTSNININTYHLKILYRGVLLKSVYTLGELLLYQSYNPWNLQANMATHLIMLCVHVKSDPFSNDAVTQSLYEAQYAPSVHSVSVFRYGTARTCAAPQIDAPPCTLAPVLAKSQTVLLLHKSRKKYFYIVSTSIL
jgi:hypothetical protein